MTFIQENVIIWIPLQAFQEEEKKQHEGIYIMIQYMCVIGIDFDPVSTIVSVGLLTVLTFLFLFKKINQFSLKNRFMTLN
jgi:hypothetical protein